MNWDILTPSHCAAHSTGVKSRWAFEVNLWKACSVQGWSHDWSTVHDSYKTEVVPIYIKQARYAPWRQFLAMEVYTAGSISPQFTFDNSCSHLITSEREVVWEIQWRLCVSLTWLCVHYSTLMFWRYQCHRFMITEIPVRLVSVGGVKTKGHGRVQVQRYGSAYSLLFFVR